MTNQNKICVIYFIYLGNQFRKLFSWWMEARHPCFVTFHNCLSSHHRLVQVGEVCHRGEFSNLLAQRFLQDKDCNTFIYSDYL